MRYLMTLLVLLTVIGCGSVDAMRADGAGGEAGQPGSGGAAGQAVDAGVDATVCIPSACNDCTGVLAPDGTACGTVGADARLSPTCSGKIGTDYRCKAGACVAGQNVDCTNFPCHLSCEVPSCFTYNNDNVQQTTAQCLCSATSACPQ